MCRHVLTMLTIEEPWKVSSVYKYVWGSMASNSRIFPMMKSLFWCFLLRRLQITLSKALLRVRWYQICMRLAGGGFAVEMTTPLALVASKDDTIFHFINVDL